jgi:hypothetical protein
MIDGDLRSAVHNQDVELLKTLSLHEEQLSYLTHQGWEWISPACVWESDGEARDSLWCLDEKQWSLSVGGLELATPLTFDLVACQHEWSVLPVLDVLPLWEEWVDKAIKAGEFDAVYRDAPRKAIEAKQAWCRGDINGAALKEARDAARSAVREARAAWSATWGARDTTGEVVAGDVAGGAVWAARTAKSAARDAAHISSDVARVSNKTTREKTYDAYCLQFTAYVILCLQEGRYAL